MKARGFAPGTPPRGRAPLTGFQGAEPLAFLRSPDCPVAVDIIRIDSRAAAVQVFPMHRIARIAIRRRRHSLTGVWGLRVR
jgi:hypothetical protein